jgi:hypothetical protein
MRRALAAICALLLSRLTIAAAQVDCFPADDSNEAQLFAAFSVPLAFSLIEAPDEVEAGAVRIGGRLRGDLRVAGGRGDGAGDGELRLGR